MKAVERRHREAAEAHRRAAEAHRRAAGLWAAGIYGRSDAEASYEADIEAGVAAIQADIASHRAADEAGIDAADITAQI